MLERGIQREKDTGSSAIEFTAFAILAIEAGPLIAAA